MREFAREMGAADGPLASPLRPRGLLARRHSRAPYGGRQAGLLTRIESGRVLERHRVDA